MATTLFETVTTVAMIEESMTICRIHLNNMNMDDTSSVHIVEEMFDSIEQRIAECRLDLIRILTQSATTPTSEPDAPIEPLADPIITLQTAPSHVHDDDEEQYPFRYIPRDCDDYEPVQCDYE